MLRIDGWRLLILLQAAIVALLARLAAILS